uniref:Uncharacterized protein n=1 Tax=Pyricularia oryzae (strain P131) TaxID=1143193 RepID=L7IT07_PYRO1
MCVQSKKIYACVGRFTTECSPEANNPNRLEDDTGAQSASATDLSAEVWWTNPVCFERTQGIDAEILPVNAVGAAAESRWRWTWSTSSTPSLTNSICSYDDLLSRSTKVFFSFRANSPLAMARHLSPHSRHRDPQLIAYRLSGSAKRLGEGKHAVPENCHWNCRWEYLKTRAVTRHPARLRKASPTHLMPAMVLATKTRSKCLGSAPRNRSCPR